MATPWCRLWADMPNDPKWRTIARVSKQRIGDVIATYVHMLICASNATERGRTQGWNDEDVATALDLETEQVTAIREAMQGRVLDGEHLAGWEKRQVAREDESASARAKAWREKQKARKAENACETQPNATERKQTTEVEVEVDTEVEKIKTKAKPPAAPAFDPMPELLSRGVTQQTATDFLQARKPKGKLTQTALNGIISEADKAGYSLERALEVACKRGWQSFDASWVQRDMLRQPARPQVNDKFHFADKDYSADVAAMNANAALRGITTIDDEMEHDL